MGKGSGGLGWDMAIQTMGLTSNTQDILASSEDVWSWATF